MVERHLDLAQRMAGLVDAAPDLERLAEVPLCIVCLRYHPSGNDEELNAIEPTAGCRSYSPTAAYAGTTMYGGRVALRPAMTNWAPASGT